MLPIPFEKFIPSFFNRDDKLNAFANKIDSILGGLADDTKSINDLVDPYKCRAVVLDELGYLLAAGIKKSDSEREKRRKIAVAVKGHKKRSTFKNHVKIIIDQICGGDSEVIRGVSGNDWLLIGEGIEPTSNYWATLGCDGIDFELGLGLVGDGTEGILPGNIYINVDNTSLTSDQIDQLILNLDDDVLPAYFQVFLGYIDGSGAFVTYTMIG